MIDTRVEKTYVASDGWHKVEVNGKYMTAYGLGDPLFKLPLSDAERIFELMDAAVMQRYIDEEEIEV